MELMKDYTNLKRYMAEKGVTERFLSVMTGIPENFMQKVTSGETSLGVHEEELITYLFAALFKEDCSSLYENLFVRFC